MGARRTPPPAKISRPRLYGASPRTRLFARLDALRERPVIWVAGPPGAGKTTLVASYLEARGIDGIWLQVDRSDADPAAFFYYLGLAARPLAPRAKPLPLLSKEFLSDLDGFARNFFRLLFARIGESSVLVLDNVHEVPEKSGFSRLLELACEEAPQGSNLIILSRHGVPVELARAEANHLVGHLEWEDLRITQDEATLIARTRQPVTDSVVARLHADCDGWAAGLTLMLDRLQRTGTIPDSTGAANRETIFNYFAREILEHVTPREERTLCISSLLPEMTARSVQDLTEDVEAGTLLDNLYRRHLFTYRREGNEPVFQFHALFRVFLLARLDELHGDDRASLRLQAAQVLEKEGATEGAIALYIGSENMTDAIRLMLSRAEEMMAQGRSQTLKDWISVLPESRLEENPWLRYWLGVAELATVPDQAQKTLTIAYRGFESRNDMSGKILVASAILQAFYVSYARFSPAKEWIALLSGLLKTGYALPTRGAELQANAVMLLANLYRNANPAEVEYWVGNLERLVEQEAPARDKLMAGIALLSYAMAAGRCDMGRRFVPLLVSLERHPNINEPTLIMWLIRKADFLHHILDFQSSIEAAHQARDLARAHGLRYAQLFACFVEAQAHYKAYEFKETDGIIEELQRLCDRSRRVELLHACGSLAWRHVWSNHPIDALTEGQIAFDVAKATRVPFFVAVWSVPVLYGYVGAGRHAEARQFLTETREALAGTVCQDVFEIVLLIVEACCEQAASNIAKAIELTRRAICLSRQFGREAYLNWIPPLIPSLMRELLVQGTDTDHVRKIVRLLRLSPPTDPMDPDWAWEMNVRTLGGFEIMRDGHVVAFSGKLPKKSLLLLKAIVAFGPGDVSEQQVLDALWPDEDGDVAQKSLSVTLLRLRRLLGDNDLIRHQGGRLSLARQRCWVDAWAFEHLLSTPGMEDGTNLEPQEKALSLYAGSFLPDDGEEPWSVPARERLRAKFVHSLVALGKELERNGLFDEAIVWYHKGLDADPIVESFYQGLMRCYAGLDRRTESIAVYRRLRQTLSITLGIPPSSTTERLYQTVRDGH